MERPLDLLGWPVHRSCSSCHLPCRDHQSHPLQEPRLSNQSLVPSHRIVMQAPSIVSWVLPLRCFIYCNYL
uniref:Pip1e n=1 Tax=Arundo donax TaxID=35708 RepID=A0A0A9EFN6_ARUDO